jgi:hypothetical protein
MPPQKPWQTPSPEPLILAVVKWSSKAGTRSRLFLFPMFYLQNGGFLLWACLDSNQGPLPYQRQ